MPNLFKSSLTPHQRKAILTDQVRVLYDGARITLSANLLTGIILGVLFWDHSDRQSVIAWLSLLAVVVLARFFHLVAFNKEPSAERNCEARLRQFRLLLGATGLVWGLATFMLYPPDSIPHQAFMIMVIAGMSAGAITILSIDIISVLSFTVPSILTLAIRLLTESTELQVGMGLLALVYLFFTTLIARRTQQSLQERVLLLLADSEKEKQLRKNEERLNEAQQIAGIGSYEWHPATGELKWSDQHFRLWGLKPGSVIPGFEIFRQGVHWEDIAMVENGIREAMESGSRYDQVFRVVWPDQSVHFIHNLGEFRLDEHGQPVIMVGTAQDVTERIEMDRLLTKREREFSALIESSPDNIIRYDMDCRATFINHMLEETVRVSASNLLGKTPLESHYEGFVGVENYQAALEQVLKTGFEQEVEIIVNNPDGEPRTHHVRFVAEHNDNGDITGALAFGRDITAQKETEAELRIAAIAMDSQEGIAITDRNQRIIKVNPAFTRITGYEAKDAIGHTPGRLLKSGRHETSFYKSMWECLNRDFYWQGEVWNRRRNGETYPQWLSITAVTDSNGEITHYVASFTDITQQKRDEETIHNLAFFDPLTELPNRRLLHERLQHTIAVCEADNRNGAIMFIDLDNFKELNDTRGHGIGDLLLIEVANRLQENVRSDDTVARLGGDEFVVVLNDLSKDSNQASRQAESIAEKLRRALAEPYQLENDHYQSSPSIGISLFSGNNMQIDELLKRADTAMYQAKQSGRNTIRFFDPATHAAMEERVLMENDLREAVPCDQFRLYYQVQVDDQRRHIGAEALIRWQHPERGMISPLQFIPMAEETGQIIPIGQWVMESACQKLKAWESNPGALGLQLSVNVSARQFHQPEFVTRVKNVLEKTGINPGNLKLELTESLVLDNINETIDKMMVLKETGIMFAMDDFGTGYSSLAYLSKLPLDQVKIDRSFVKNMLVNKADAIIVQTIIGMARNLNMEVIAEGVETEEQRSFLAKSGCLNYQGYLFSEPLPEDSFELILAENCRRDKRA